MILVDANLLLYAANRAAPEHERARAWLDDRLNGTVPLGLPWPSLLAFVRLATNPLVVRCEFKRTVVDVVERFQSKVSEKSTLLSDPLTASSPDADNPLARNQSAPQERPPA